MCDGGVGEVVLGEYEDEWAGECRKWKKSKKQEIETKQNFPVFHFPIYLSPAALRIFRLMGKMLERMKM